MIVLWIIHLLEGKQRQWKSADFGGTESRWMRDTLKVTRFKWNRGKRYSIASLYSFPTNAMDFNESIVCKTAHRFRSKFEIYAIQQCNRNWRTDFFNRSIEFDECTSEWSQKNDCAIEKREEMLIFSWGFAFWTEIKALQHRAFTRENHLKHIHTHEPYTISIRRYSAIVSW